MKCQVKIKNRSFTVEIQDIYARPIIAYVDGDAVEVWPELNATQLLKPVTRTPASVEDRPEQKRTFSTQPQPIARSSTNNNKTVVAPIPGIVTSILVGMGDNVDSGQPLCIIEAMKMKNTLRSPLSGTIAKIHVSAHQTIQHRDILFTFSE